MRATARPVRGALLSLLALSIFGLLQQASTVEAATAAATTTTTRSAAAAAAAPSVGAAGAKTYLLEAALPSRTGIITTTAAANGTVVRAVAAMDDGGAFVVGDFRAPSIRLGGITLTNLLTTLKTPTADLFVARLQPDGAVAWAYAWGGDADDFGRCVAWDAAQGKLYVLGDFRSSILTVADGAGRRVGLSKGMGNDLDLVVARLDGATGAVEWLTRLGDDTGDDAGTALVLDPHRQGVLHVAGWFDFHDVWAGTTTRDTFVSVLEATTGEELVERGEFWTGEGNEVLTAMALSPSDGLLYVAGVSDSPELLLGLGGILLMGGTPSAVANYDGLPRAFLVAIDTRRREVAWSLALGEVAAAARSKEPDTAQAGSSSLPLAGVTAVAVDPTDSAAVYVSGAFTSPQALQLMRAQYPAKDAPQAAFLLRIDAKAQAVVWAGVPPAATVGVGALAMDTFGFAYAVNEREVVKLGRIHPGAPATIVTRQNLVGCGGGGPTDLAVDVRGSAYVTCMGGSVARALVVRCVRVGPGDKTRGMLHN